MLTNARVSGKCFGLRIRHSGEGRKSMERLNHARKWTPASAGVTIPGSNADPVPALGNCTLPQLNSP